MSSPLNSYDRRSLDLVRDDVHRYLPNVPAGIRMIGVLDQLLSAQSEKEAYDALQLLTFEDTNHLVAFPPKTAARVTARTRLMGMMATAERGNGAR